MLRPIMRGVLLAAMVAAGSPQASSQDKLAIPLQMDAGSPLRLYITKRIRYRLNQPVEAKVAEPVWAFDRQIIPSGSMVQGCITRLDPVSRKARVMAILNGDFTPLKRAQVTFTKLTIPDGRTFELSTQASTGLPTIYVPPKPAKPPKRAKKPANSNAKSAKATAFLKQQAQSQMNARTRGLYDMVRGPSKREWVENFLISKLPYHPQWYRKATRFDAMLTKPLDFGEAQFSRDALEEMGTQPVPDSTADMRLLTTLSSADAKVGDPLQGELAKPLFSPDNKLLLPQGTLLNGKITMGRRARLFHRGGKLRFALEGAKLPPLVSAYLASSAQEAARRSGAIQAQLAAAEADPKALKVDQEGTAQATESKTRLLRPAIAGLVAAKSIDDDVGKHTASGTGAANTGGRSLGGFSGFGLLGIATAQGPKAIGGALGFYGLAWSAYSNVVARGREVTFEKNTDMAIRFGAAPRAR